MANARFQTNKAMMKNKRRNKDNLTSTHKLSRVGFCSPTKIYQKKEKKLMIHFSAHKLCPPKLFLF